jgi:HEAT repeat protein
MLRPAHKSADVGHEMKGFRAPPPAGAALLLGACVCLCFSLPAAPARGAAGTTAEPAITTGGVEGDYVRALHVRIHWRWTANFVDVIQRTRPPKDKLNDPSLRAELSFAVRWDGSAADVKVARGSGVAAFDQAAVAAIRGDIPYPVPPLELFGDDGVAHFRWVFARDSHLCSEGEVRRAEDPLEEALPRLFVQGRIKEALLRVARYMRGGSSEAMGTFARAWLARPLADPLADAQAAAALARLGDARQIARLKPALGRAETVAVAATALSALKVDVCQAVHPALTGKDPAARLLAMTALREAGARLSPESPCAQALAATLDDGALPAETRASALQTLAGLTSDGAHHAVITHMQDADAHLRAAAATALARPGGGRPSLYRLEPLLRDPSVEVRAAAAAGLVRACGELSFDYLRPLFKDGDARPLLAMAPELGRSPSPAALDLLAKMLKRAAPELRFAVMRALAGRSDEGARALVRPLLEAAKQDPRAPLEMRVLAYAGAETDEILQLARDPMLGHLAFKALVRAKRHREAADWLVASFDRLTPDLLVDLFSTWLANPPPRVAAASKRG